MCSDGDKIEIFDEVKRIFGIIKGRGGSRSGGDSINDNDSTSKHKVIN